MRYIIAESVNEALNALKEGAGKAIVLAGGTDLVLDRESGKKKADAFVDIMRIPEMIGIRKEGDEIVIGAATLLSDISKSPLILEHFPSLAVGSGSVGSLQIRNSATLTGNVISAQPAADAAMSLAPLNPRFVIRGINGDRESNMQDMYAGFGKSTLDPYSEVLTEIHIPCLKATEAAGFGRIELRKSLSLPMLNAAAMARVVNGVTEEVRITMGPVGVGPVRAAVAEEWLTGKPWTAENIKAASKLVLENAKPRSNPLRGSKEYRVATLPVLVERILKDIGRQLGIEN